MSPSAPKRLTPVDREVIVQLYAQRQLAKYRRRHRMQRGRQMGPGESGGMQAFAWFVWEHGHAGPPALGWLE